MQGNEVIDEDEYWKSRELLQNILDSSTEYSNIVTDKNGIIRFFNKGAENLLGFKAEEVVGKETPLLYHHHDMKFTKKDIEKIHKEAIKKGRSVGFRELCSKNKKKIPVYSSVTPLKDPNGKIIGFLNNHIDRKREKELIKELILYKNVLDSGDDCVLITDRKRKILYANKPFLDMYEYDSLDEIFGKSTSIFNPEPEKGSRVERFLQEKNGEEHDKLIDKKLKGTETVIWTGEINDITKMGKIIPILLTLSQVKDEKGNIIGRLGVSKNIQHEKNLESVRIIAKSINSTLDYERTLNIMLKELEKLISNDHQYLILFDWENNKYNMYGDEVKEDKIPKNFLPEFAEKGIKSWINKNKKSIIIPNIEIEIRTKLESDAQYRERKRSLIGVPIFNFDKNQPLIGQIIMGSFEKFHFTNDDLKLLELFSAEASIAIINSEHHRKIVREKEDFKKFINLLPTGVFRLDNKERIILITHILRFKNSNI